MTKILQAVKNLTIPDNGTFNNNVPVMDFAYLEGYFYYIKDTTIHRLSVNGDDEIFTNLGFNAKLCPSIHIYKNNLVVFNLRVFAEYAGGLADSTTTTYEIYLVDLTTREVTFNNVVSSSQTNTYAYLNIYMIYNSSSFIKDDYLYFMGILGTGKSGGGSYSGRWEIEELSSTNQYFLVGKINMSEMTVQEYITPNYLENFAGSYAYRAEIESGKNCYDLAFAVGLAKQTRGRCYSLSGSTVVTGETSMYSSWTNHFYDTDSGSRRGGNNILFDGDAFYFLQTYTFTYSTETFQRGLYKITIDDLAALNSLSWEDFRYGKYNCGSHTNFNLNQFNRYAPTVKIDNKLYGFGGYSTEIDSNNIVVLDLTTGIETTLPLPYPNSKGGQPIVNGEYIYVPTDAGIGIYQLKEYNITYSIKGNNIDIALDGNTPLSQVTFSSSLGYQYYNFETLTGTVTGSYEAQPPVGHRIIGYSLKPRAKTPDFILGETYDVSIDKDTIFYEVYGVYRPPVVTFDLNLYQNTAERNRVDKTNYLTLQGTLQGALRGECSLTAPVITLELDDIPTFNYVYIEKFGRWYYVTDITSLRANLWLISLTVDTLMTYKDGIKLCSAFIDRNENSYDPLIVDNKLPLKQGQTITEYTLNNTVFTDKTGQFLLTGILVSQGDAVEVQALSEGTEQENEPFSTVVESEV